MTIINESELQPLELHLYKIANQRGCFPQRDGVDYFMRYWSLKKYLEQNYFKNIGAALSSKDGIVFTSHGPEHFDKVIEFAGYLVGRENNLEFYEVYLLLCAILLHDAGNLFGRIGHEKKAFGILIDADPRADRIELKAISQIAEAHGGHTGKGDKDTIGEISKETTSYLGKRFRPKLLAALVRFADEICEDRTRAAKILLDKNELNEATAYHKYADSIYSVRIDETDRSVVIAYCFSKSDALRKFKKSGSEVYLLDEIFTRLSKMNAERIYCNRYYSDIVSIRRIRVTIEIVDDNMEPVTNNISLLIEDAGYPVNLPDVSMSCDEEGMTGEKLFRRLSGQEE